jgi:hypothetical protein
LKDNASFFDIIDHLKLIFLVPLFDMKVQLPNGHKYDGVWLNAQRQRALSVRNRRNAEPVYHFY